MTPAELVAARDRLAAMQMARADEVGWSVVDATSGRCIVAPSYPKTRVQALADAVAIDKAGGRCWVEHAESERRSFESAAEVAHRAAREDRDVPEITAGLLHKQA